MQISYLVLLKVYYNMYDNKNALFMLGTSCGTPISNMGEERQNPENPDNVGQNSTMQNPGNSGKEGQNPTNKHF